MKVRIVILTALVTLLLAAVLSVDAQQPTCTVVVKEVTPDGWIIMTVNGETFRAKPQTHAQSQPIHMPICEAFADKDAPVAVGQRRLWKGGDPWGIGNAGTVRTPEGESISGVKVTPVSFVDSGVLLLIDAQPRTARSDLELARGHNPLCATSPEGASYTVWMSLEVAQRDTRLLRRDGRVVRRAQ